VSLHLVFIRAKLDQILIVQAAAIMRLLVVGIGVLSMIGPAIARDVFVNNVAGNDRYDGRGADGESGSGPVRSLDRALRLVDRGGRVVIANTGEPYREMISLSDVHHRGYPDQPLVIAGNGATLDGTVVAAPGAWRYENDHIFSFRPRRLAYQQLFRDARPLPHVRAASFLGSRVGLGPMQWTLLTDRIALRVEEGRLPEQYGLRHAGLQTGITLYNTQYVRIEDLVVQGFQQEGINAHELVTHCELVRVECRANGRSGISVGGVSRVSIIDSNCYDNGRAQLRVEGLARVTAQRCDFGSEMADVPRFEVQGLGKAIIDGAEFTNSIEQ
jgi:hypothetical protein